MKTSFYYILFLVASLSFAQTSDGELVDGPKIVFAESTFEFGEIQQGDKVEHTFTYTNVGNKPLIFESVRTTCGCTATNWDKNPLAPGESGTILVKFNSTGKIGMQNKVVTIMSNAVNNPERIKIVTNVLKPETSTQE